MRRKTFGVIFITYKETGNPLHGTANSYMISVIYLVYARLVKKE